MAVVVMWVVLVAAWAIDKALAAGAAGHQRDRAAAARANLARVGELSGVFNEVNQAVEASVVKIDAQRPASPRGTAGRAGPLGMPMPPENSGSGVIVAVEEAQGVAGREAGYVVTNHHVVAGASRTQVTLADGRTIDARLLGSDPDSDLAVLRVVADGLVAAEWGDSDALRKGDWVLAFGSPFGFVGSMTAGIVSALNRTQTDGIIGPRGDRAFQSFIQVDAAINPGNSGGPLVGVDGRVVGINTAIFTRTGDFSGIGFAIPSNQARRVYEDIRQQGRVIRGWLGVRLAATDEAPDAARRLGFDPSADSGVIVTEVYRGQPAAEAGLRRGDVITRIDGQPVDDFTGVRNRAAFARPGEELTLGVVRGGEAIEVELTVGEQPPGLLELPLPAQGSAAVLGLTLADPPRQGRTLGNPPAAVIADVAEGSAAWEAGLRPGDLLLAVDGRAVDGEESARVRLAQTSPVLGVELRVASGGRVFDVVVRETP